MYNKQIYKTVIQFAETFAFFFAEYIICENMSPQVR